MPTATASFTPDLDEEIADDKAYVGTPAQVREQIAQLVEQTGVEYVVLRPLFGDLPIDRALYSFHLFVNEVMPAFRGSGAAAVASA
jgi:alkanesulfonate monooxygenase SsuD/methylene tetrahydromethanopterin reductase-like flavin-dependent oxidoreductase (luciferase family)